MALDAVAHLFERLAPAVASARRLAGTLSLLGALAGAAIGWALFHDGLPDKTESLLGRIAVVVLALLPGAVLAALWLALGEVLELPARVRRLPEAARSHADELERALRDLDEPRSGFRRRGRALWRLARLHGSAAETVRFYAPLTALLSVPFVTASLAAALIVPIELVLALIVLFVAT